MDHRSRKRGPFAVCLVAIDQLGDMSRNTFRGASNQLSGS